MMTKLRAPRATPKIPAVIKLKLFTKQDGLQHMTSLYNNKTDSSFPVLILRIYGVHSINNQPQICIFLRLEEKRNSSLLVPKY